MRTEIWYKLNTEIKKKERIYMLPMAFRIAPDSANWPKRPPRPRVTNERTSSSATPGALVETPSPPLALLRFPSFSYKNPTYPTARPRLLLDGLVRLLVSFCWFFNLFCLFFSILSINSSTSLGRVSKGKESALGEANLLCRCVICWIVWVSASRFEAD